MLDWDAKVAGEARHEARRETAFDHADALAGGLPDAYIALRKHWIASLAPLAVVVRR